jgi:hypothetical protein
MLDTNEYPELKYPWQRAVLDVFREFDPDGLPAKINIAEHAIADRLGDGTTPDESEYTAIGDAQRALQFLFPKRVEHKQESPGKSEAA